MTIIPDFEDPGCRSPQAMELHYNDLMKNDAVRVWRLSGALGIMILSGCMPKSWATEAEYPPARSASLGDIHNRRSELYFKAVSTHGTVFRVYGPNAISVRDGDSGPFLLILVGDARSDAEGQPFKLGQAVRLNVVVREGAGGDSGAAMFPAVPAKDLDMIGNRPALEAYEIFRD